MGQYQYQFNIPATCLVLLLLIAETNRSRDQPIPHALVPLPSDRIQEDLRYDVQVEMELVRPPPGQEETGKSIPGPMYKAGTDSMLQATLCYLLSYDLSEIQGL